MGLRKDTEHDPGWAHGERVKPDDRSKVRCKYCHRELHGGINRFKCHLGHVRGNTKGCIYVPVEVREKIRAHLERMKKEGKKKAKEREKQRKENEGIVGTKPMIENKQVQSITPLKTSLVFGPPPRGVITENPSPVFGPPPGGVTENPSRMVDHSEDSSDSLMEFVSSFDLSSLSFSWSPPPGGVITENPSPIYSPPPGGVTENPSRMVDHSEDSSDSLMEFVSSFDLSSLSFSWPPPPPSALPSGTIAPSTTASELSKVAPSSFATDSLQQHLQSFIESASERWTYAIFWELSVDYSGASILGWGDGYFAGEENPGKQMSAASAVQEHRKKVLRDLYFLINGADDVFDEEVSESEWFFLVSMTHSFINGGDLPGKAFFSGMPKWIAGEYQLATCPWERVRQARSFGLQSMVCIPFCNGVLEVGSTKYIDDQTPSTVRSLLSRQLSDRRNPYIEPSQLEILEFLQQTSFR